MPPLRRNEMAIGAQQTPTVRFGSEVGAQCLRENSAFDVLVKSLRFMLVGTMDFPCRVRRFSKFDKRSGACIDVYGTEKRRKTAQIQPSLSASRCPPNFLVDGSNHSLWPPPSPGPSLLSSVAARKSLKIQRLGASLFVGERLTPHKLAASAAPFSGVSPGRPKHAFLLVFSFKTPDCSTAPMGLTPENNF